MIPLFKVRMENTAIKRAEEVLASGYIGQGKVVDEFENKLKDYFGTPYVATMNSATSALHLAFHMLKSEHEGCEVLCSPLTCTATNWPVFLNGYKIKWVDVDPDICNMDLKDLERKLSHRTKILYLVHWGGYPIDYDKLYWIQNRFRDRYGFSFKLVEDCAHAMGSEWNGDKLGAMQYFAAYSFQAIKHVTSIDGGALLCPNKELYSRTKLLRWYGIDRESNRKDFRCEDDIKEIGYKFHMNDVSAAVGVENLKMFDGAFRNKYCANVYDSEFKNHPDIRLIPYNDNCSYWLYTMFVRRQSAFMTKMKEKGIMVSRVHERNDKHSCVKDFQCELPNLDKIVKEMICIPCGWWVTDENLSYIVKTIKEGW
jgi:dTDP-4-amino-4,6-dideoxygalactose transaminase